MNEGYKKGIMSAVRGVGIISQADLQANHMMRGKWFKLEAMCREYWPFSRKAKNPDRFVVKKVSITQGWRNERSKADSGPHSTLWSAGADCGGGVEG